MGGFNSGWGGIGTALISTGIGAFGAYREAQAANQAAEYNAGQYRYKADQARTRGMFDLTLLRRENRQSLSALTQGVSNSGVEVGSGSAVRLLASQKGMDEKAEQIQKYNTEVEATGYERQAAMIRAQKANPWSAAFKTLMGGVTQTYSQYQKYQMYTSARNTPSYSSSFWPS